MEKYENLEKLFSMIDSILGFIFSIPWWGWVLTVLALSVVGLIDEFQQINAELHERSEWVRRNCYPPDHSSK